ncbi:MAG: hypothetical protein ACTSVO_05865 [Candidatus Heimdallarchaeaceae archaeon]
MTYHGDATSPPTPPTSSYKDAYGFAFECLSDVTPRITRELVHSYNPATTNLHDPI